MKYIEIKRRYLRAQNNIYVLMERYGMLNRGAIPFGIEESFCNRFKVNFTDDGEIKNYAKVVEKLDTLSEEERREWKRR